MKHLAALGVNLIDERPLARDGVGIFFHLERRRIVQIAHHGKTGGTVALYEKIDADVLLWPGGVANFNGDGSLDCLRTRDYNAKALELAEEAYIAGANIFTLIMPYTPEDVETPRIIY